jgi:hypothetical protein
MLRIRERSLPSSSAVTRSPLLATPREHKHDQSTDISNLLSLCSDTSKDRNMHARSDDGVAHNRNHLADDAAYLVCFSGCATGYTEGTGAKLGHTNIDVISLRPGGFSNSYISLAHSAARVSTEPYYRRRHSANPRKENPTLSVPVRTATNGQHRLSQNRAIRLGLRCGKGKVY